MGQQRGCSEIPHSEGTVERLASTNSFSLPREFFNILGAAKRNEDATQSHGLRPVDPNSPTGPVVTKTSKRHEGASFLDHAATFEAAAIIEDVCKDIPLHVVFGQEGTLVYACDIDILSLSLICFQTNIHSS